MKCIKFHALETERGKWKLFLMVDYFLFPNTTILQNTTVVHNSKLLIVKKNSNM